MIRTRWRGILLLIGLLNFAWLQIGCWWFEPWREEYGFTFGRPFAMRGLGCYGEDGFVLLSWRWGFHRPEEYAQRSPPSSGDASATPSRRTAIIG